MDFELYYLIIGVIIHGILFYWVNTHKYLKWPDGVILASILSFSAYLAHFALWFILVWFFIPSSILSKSNSEKKNNIIIEKNSSQRRGTQVISNSIGFMIFSWLQLFENGILGDINLIYFLSGAVYIISATSDTWSTEIGTLNKSNPRNILNLRETLPKGTSGAVSALGTLGGLFGSIYLSVLTIFTLYFLKINQNYLLLFLSLVIFGFLGQLIDSFLGATIQTKFYCLDCNVNVEDRIHKFCKSNELSKVKFYTFLDNNSVNLVSNSIVTILSYFLFSIIL